MKAWKGIFCLLLVLSVCSCGRVRVPPIAALGEALACCQLPSGTVYTRSGEEGGADLTGEMQDRLFDGGEDALRGAQSFALYLSARERVCEAAIFYCYSAGEAKKIAELCLARGEELKRYDGGILSQVAVKGKYVLFAACEEPDTVVSALGRALKG